LAFLDQVKMDEQQEAFEHFQIRAAEPVEALLVSAVQQEAEVEVMV
jgi:hypothetical protein